MPTSCYGEFKPMLGGINLRYVAPAFRNAAGREVPIY